MSEHVSRLRKELESGEVKDSEDVMVGSVGHILKSTFAPLFAPPARPAEEASVDAPHGTS